MDDDAEVLFERRGPIGHIVLNRPRAINALTHDMVVAIAATLELWAVDDAVETVILRGAGERGLCAGGDIVSLYRAATGGDPDSAARFWRDEYALDLRISRYPKPVIAIMDGVTLGGGVGLAGHASHRVVTERSMIGMPETTIGFIPDVGGTWLLSHAPGELGTYLALSATSVGPGDAIALGLADYYVPSGSLVELVDTGRIVSAEPPPPVLVPQRHWIDEAFAGDDLAAILARIEGREIAAVIATKSPTALAVTLESLRRARHLPDLEATLAQELGVSLRALAAPDFAEGVRAQVIDKDRKPQWTPARVEDVLRESVESYFS